jgi:diguanylate cyclase (GGDEF)-like protein
MRISTITHWAYGVTVLLTGLSGAAFLFAAHAGERERDAVAQHLAFDVLAEDLAVGTGKLTTEARLYAVRGAARHAQAYRAELLEVRTRERARAGVRAAGATAGELAAIAEAERDLGDLNRLEGLAVEAARTGNSKLAQDVLFGPEHERAEAGVLSALEHFRALTSARTETQMRQAQASNDAAILVAKTMLTITALLFLGVLYFVLSRRVAIPLTRMTGIVTRLARQDYAVEVPNDPRRDEIGDMTHAIQVFRENGLERERLEIQRQADQRAKDSILQMMHRLQSCETRQELGEVVACFAPQTFPDLAGRLYGIDEDRNALTLVSSWMEPVHSPASFAPTACWGVRRGRPHASNGEHSDVSCPHIADPDVHSLCVPLTAQGEVIGLLYFEERAGVAERHEAVRVYLELMSDNIALSLANLRLRERLATLAVRDALTGLFNRRSLDEALERRPVPHQSLACIMIDIDHFKRFNDTFGHDAGDAVMQHVAQIMVETTDGVGAAYRFGGEEFTILLPGADETAAIALAERLRAHVAATPLAHHGRLLGHVTISLGVAISPDDGPPSMLLRRADAALLNAKAVGRDRTVSASQLAAA